MYLTLSVHWHVQIPDLSICAKDLAKMAFGHILRELFNNNLATVNYILQYHLEYLTFVLRTGLGLLPRLALRLLLLYLPFRRGVRLSDRGETVRRGLDGDLELFLSTETSEYGERLRPRPLDGDRDLEGMFE